MITKDIRLGKFLCMSILCFSSIAIFRYSIQNERGIQWVYMYDKVYVMLYAPIVLIGKTLIAQHFNYLSCYRFGTRMRIVLWKLITYFVFTCIMTTLVLLGTLVAIFLNRKSIVQISVYELLESPAYFFLGSYLLICISMVFEYAKQRFVRTHASFVAYAVLCAEVLILVPVIKRVMYRSVSLLFSWLFQTGEFLPYNILLGYIIVFNIILFSVSGKKDFLD